MKKEIKVLQEILLTNDGLYQYNETLAQKIADILYDYVISKDEEYKKEFTKLQV